MMTPRTASLLKPALQLFQKGDYVRALDQCLRIRQQNPSCVEALQLGGEAALASGDLSKALLLLTQALRLNSGNTACALKLGTALLQAKQFGQAELVLAHAAQGSPQTGEAWALLASAYKAQGRVQEAMQSLAKAVEVRPRDAELHTQLGAILVDAVGHAAGELHFKKAAELAPKEPTHWTNLGICLAYRKDLEGALPCFDKAIRLDPKFAKAFAGRGLVMERLYRIEEAVKDYAEAVKHDPDAWDARSCHLLNLHYLNTYTSRQIFDYHRQYGEALGARSQETPMAVRQSSDGKVRVGFLGPDFRAHSVAYFLEPLLENLDPTRFEIHIYHDHARQDWMTERLRALASHWNHVAGMPHDTLVERIRSDQLDILIDLAGHTGFNRLHLYARRLAPVQASYLGYPDTTGVQQMDWRITDAQADPLGVAESLHTERLARMPQTAWCYRAPAKAPACAPVPSIQNGSAPVFGCFNNFTKINDPLLESWGRILRAIPGARLLLKNHGLEQETIRTEVLQRCAKAGLDPQRVDLLGRTEAMEDHLALYGRMDLALDTFPYHGTTTTCEAVWMGVPVITLKGDRHCARVGCSLLHNLGHPEWIAQDWADYESKAIALALNQNALKELRTQLRDTLNTSIICNAKAQGANFGTLLEQMLRT